MKNGFRLYSDLTVLDNVKKDKKSHVQSIYHCLYYANSVKQTEGYMTQKHVKKMNEQLQDEKSQLVTVVNSYKPSVILKKSIMANDLEIVLEGSVSDLKKTLDSFKERNSKVSTLLLYTKSKIIAIHYSSDENRFTPFIVFEPSKQNKANVYYFKSTQLIEHFIKENFDIVLLRFSIVRIQEASIVFGDAEVNFEKDVKKDNTFEEAVSPTGFTKFIDQFIKGEKKVEPTDRLLIQHEKQIKSLKKELLEEKDYSAQLFNVIVKLQNEIQKINIEKIGKTSEKVLKEVQEIKKLNKFKKIEEMTVCCICLENKKDTLLMPCLHLCLCGKCYPKVFENFGVCPICQTKITKSIGNIKYV